MEPLFLLVAVALGLTGGVVLGTRLGRAKGGGGAAALAAAEEEAEKIRAAAKAEIEAIKKAAEVEGKELARKHKAELDEELRARRTELQKREEGLAGKERDLDKQRREDFTGIENFFVEDACATETQGPIWDRSRAVSSRSGSVR